jgi:hypothetical protein
MRKRNGEPAPDKCGSLSDSYLIGTERFFSHHMFFEEWIWRRILSFSFVRPHEMEEG